MLGSPFFLFSGSTYYGDAERFGPDRDAHGEEDEEARERDLPRRQLGAGAGAEHRRAALDAAQALGTHHAHQAARRRLPLRRRTLRGGPPEAAAPVHQVRLSPSLL